MAISIQEGTQFNHRQNLNPAYQDFYLRADGLGVEINNGATNARYILKIKDNLNNLLVTLTAPARTDLDGDAIFNVASVVQDYCKTDDTGCFVPPFAGYENLQTNSTFNGVLAKTDHHAIHKIDKLSGCNNNIKGFRFTISATYTNASGTVITTNETQSVLQNYYWFWNGVQQHVQGQRMDLTPYMMVGGSKNLLSSLPNTVNRKVRLGDYHTMAVFQGTYKLDNADVTSDARRYRFKLYNSSDSLLETINFNADSSNGGISAGGIGHFYTHRILYIGCGVQNIINAHSSNFANVAYYTLEVRNEASATMSHVYRFDITDADCKGYENIRLAFVNRLGAWDYYNFDKKSIRTTNIVRSNYKQSYGFDKPAIPYAASAGWDYATQEGGAKTYNVNAREIIEANTDFITEDEANLLEELFTSPDVHIQNANGNFEPVVITASEYIKQTTVNNKVKQYFITLEKGHETRIQRN